MGTTCGLLIVFDNVSSLDLLEMIGKNSLIIMGIQNVIVKYSVLLSKYFENKLIAIGLSFAGSAAMISIAIIILNKTKMQYLVRLPKRGASYDK